MDALPHEHSNLEVDTLTESKPVELSQDRSDVFSTGRAANQTSSAVLDGLTNGLQHKGTMSTKPVFEKIAKVVCPVMSTYDICAFDTGTD